MGLSISRVDRIEKKSFGKHGLLKRDYPLPVECDTNIGEP